MMRLWACGQRPCVVHMSTGEVAALAAQPRHGQTQRYVTEYNGRRPTPQSPNVCCAWLAAITRATRATPRQISRYRPTSRPIPTTGARRSQATFLQTLQICDTTLVARRQLRHLPNTRRPAILAVADQPSELSRYTAGGLLADEPRRKKAKVTIVAEVERLHWRIWNGKAKNARKTFDRIRRFMHLYKGERGHRTRGVATRKLWHALHEIDKYLRSQSARLVNYAARHRAAMRVGTAVTEGTANFLVNRRMDKSQQMRWSRRGADLVLQVRCAVYNGTLGSGFGQRFEPIGRPDVTVKIAA